MAGAPRRVDVRATSGEVNGSVDLDCAMFGIEPNNALMHQVVTAQLAARRSGSQSTLTRAEVSGGGAKPWRQKGTGRARQGSTRAPHWVGGGVALGPKPRSYAQRTPKKMIRLALRGVLSDRAAQGRVAVVDGWPFEGPSTKAAVSALAALGVEGKVLVVLEERDEAAFKSFRNLGHVHALLARELNAYDVLVSDWVVFTRSTLPTASASSTADSSRATAVTVTESAGNAGQENAGPENAGPENAGQENAGRAPGSTSDEGEAS